MTEAPTWERPPGRDKPHTSHLRKGRFSEPGRAYLITTVTEARQPAFLDFNAGRRLVTTLRYLHEHDAAHTLAFVVMPDHLHWLMALGEGQQLPSVVRRMKSFSSRRICDEFGLSSPLWQDGYHDHAVRDDEDLRGMARYIVANPLRAGLARSVGEYPLWDAQW